MNYVFPLNQVCLNDGEEPPEDKLLDTDLPLKCSKTFPADGTAVSFGWKGSFPRLLTQGESWGGGNCLGFSWGFCLPCEPKHHLVLPLELLLGPHRGGALGDVNTSAAVTSPAVSTSSAVESLQGSPGTASGSALLWSGDRWLSPMGMAGLEEMCQSGHRWSTKGEIRSHSC